MSIKNKHVQVVILRNFLVTILSCVMLIVAACSSKKHELPPPAKLTSETQCNACGMIIKNYAGPHAQIAWKNGKYSYYCDLLEAMPEILERATSQRILAIYVQDFTGLKWGAYAGKWINAKEAYFVVDSDQLGAMGISYTPFKSKQAAQAFQQQHGGQVYAFAQLTQAVVDNSNALMRQYPDKYMPDLAKHDHRNVNAQ